MSAMDNNYGVLLFDSAWETLGEAVGAYIQEGSIGKYLYCKRIDYLDNFIELTFSPEHVNCRIDNQISISIPSSFVKLIVTSSEADASKIGFIG